MTPALTLDYLRALSADLRAAVVLDAHGALLAGPAQLHAPAVALLEHAPAATALAGRRSDGAVFAVRDADHAIVAVTGPHALSRLTVHDLRTALSALGREIRSREAPEPAPDAFVNGLLRAISAS